MNKNIFMMPIYKKMPKMVNFLWPFLFFSLPKHSIDYKKLVLHDLQNTYTKGYFSVFSLFSLAL